MRYRRRRVPDILRSLGPTELALGLAEAAWRLLFGLAWAYRRTFLRSTHLVAVIGSYGKTTTARAVSAVLLDAPRMNGPWSGVALAVLGTPPGHHHAVVEAAIIAPGQMARYARMLKPDIVVVTSIGYEHNGTVGPVETIRAEKAEMLRRLPPAGTVVANGDDPNVRWMVDQTRARRIWFGLGSAHDVGASDIQLDWPHGTRFRLHAAGFVREVRTRLVGRHMVYPILAAVAVALAEGWEMDRIVPALEAFDPTPGRMQPVRLPGDAWVLRDDFKGSTETIAAALDTLAAIPARRRIVVLGDGEALFGDPEAAHRAFGEHAARVADRVVLFTKDHLAANRAGFDRGGLPQGGGRCRSVTSVAAAVHSRPRTGLEAREAVDLVKGHGPRSDWVAWPWPSPAEPVRCELPACRSPDPMRALSQGSSAAGPAGGSRSWGGR